MKKLLASTLLLSASLTTHAALVDMGGYNHDTSTGLHWLDLTYTDGMTYTSAPGIYLGRSWRYATNAEVEQMFSSHFVTISPTSPGFSYEGSLPPSTITNIHNYLSIFGLTQYQGTYGYHGSLAFYNDEDGVVRIAGPQFYNTDNGSDTYNMYALEHPTDYTAMATSGSIDVGVFLVSEVPVPAAVWLLGSGLIGLVGMARRRKA